jgi:hypothetical protein
MRLPIALFALMLPAGPALAQYGFGPPAEEVARLVERARDLPLGTGENPVRVDGPPGERAYIARLRCSNGVAPRVGQRHNDGVGAFGTIVDVYPLDCGDAAPGRFEIVMDMYHPTHHETRAPAGFTLQPDGREDDDDNGETTKPTPPDPTV